MSNNSSHNWFHLGDKQSKWRRFYFDLSLVGHREWRISHALSHHLLTNTYADLEVSSVEPLLQYLPVPMVSHQPAQTTESFSLMTLHFA